MGYLGYKPADKPLTSADITDSIITSAKIVDGTIANADVSSSAAIALSKLSTTGTASSANFLRGDGAWSTAGGVNTPIFVAKSSSDQSVTNGTWTKVSFGTEDIDTGSVFASSKFTANFTGKMFLNAKVILDYLNDQKFIVINIYKNGGSSAFGSQSISNSGTYEIAIQTSIIDSCVSGDYYEVYFYQSDSVARNLRGSLCVFSGFKLIE